MTEETSQRKGVHRAAPIVVALLIGVITLLALGGVNVTWDEALGDFFFGQRNLSFLTSLDAKYLDFDADPYPASTTPDLSSSAFRNRPWEHPPAAATLAAATSFATSNLLGLLDPFDGFHAVNALFAAALTFGLWRFLLPRFGLTVTITAIGLLFTMPRVFAHQIANIKDFPLMVLFSLSLLAFLEGYERGSRRWLVVAGALWGVALATRPNALFLPLIPLATVLIAKRPQAWVGRTRSLAITSAAAGAAGVAALLACWPYLWAAPVSRYLEHVRFLTGRSETTRAESLAPAFEALLLTTPAMVIALFVVGLWPLTQRLTRRDTTGWVLAFWLINIPIRYLLPGSINYDGVRHFLEIFPPIAIVAAMGLALPISHTQRFLKEHRSTPRWLKVLAPAFIVAGVLLPAAWTLRSSHPFQIAYWNSFAGGPNEAWRQKRPQAGDYWGLSYRQGLKWLNENAPPNSAVAVPVIEHAVRLVAPVRLRADLGVLNLTTPYSPELRPNWRFVLAKVSVDAPVYVMMVPRRDWMNELMVESMRRLEPVAEWKLGEAPILMIYKWE